MSISGVSAVNLLIAFYDIHGRKFSLWIIHKEGLCPSSGDINRLMMMMMEEKERRYSFVLSRIPHETNIQILAVILKYSAIKYSKIN
jgi:hypothetical protein